MFETNTHAEAIADQSLMIMADRSDFAASWVVGAGIYLPVYDGKARVALDFGPQYLNGGTALYQAGGGMIDSDARIRLNTARSTTQMLVLRMGTRIGL